MMSAGSQNRLKFFPHFRIIRFDYAARAYKEDRICHGANTLPGPVNTAIATM
jgi:hypothetical protein